MFLTRSIRRKMICGLVLVLVMLIAVSLSGVYAQNRYRDVIADLDRAIHDTPRRADLVAAIAVLLEPLQLRLNGSPAAQKFQQQQFRQRLQQAQQGLDTFHRKLDRLPPSRGVQARQPVTIALLGQIKEQLQSLEQPTAAWDAGHIQYRVNQLQALALQIPDPQEGQAASLRKKRAIYHTLKGLNTAMISVAVVLFLGLAVGSYGLIFAPLRRLYQGTARVAQGDFDYRVAIDTHDEVGQLAASFNKMTDRFQEIKRDLDRQVEERSRQLVRSERLADVGFLSAGVAHEINNPLSAIVMASESLSSRLDDLLGACDDTEKRAAREYLEMIRRESFRCREITTRLLDFARGQNAKREPNDLTHTIREVVTMVGHLGKYRDRTIRFDRTTPCYLEFNGPEIKQVVLNLVANGLESTEDDGTVTIEVQEQVDHALLTIRDYGCGMTPEVIENLFDPFFTRSRTGRGTGLGLSISHRIISEHGGTIQASSPGPAQGSTFGVFLPRRQQAEELAA